MLRAFRVLLSLSLGLGCLLPLLIPVCLQLLLSDAFCFFSGTLRVDLLLACALCFLLALGCGLRHAPLLLIWRHSGSCDGERVAFGREYL